MRRYPDASGLFARDGYFRTTEGHGTRGVGVAEVTTMTKRTITTFWTAGAVLIAVAAILVIGNGVALLDHLAALPTGRGVTADDFSRSALALMILGGSLASIGLIAELAAWIGSLANTHRLTDRRWFVTLLWAGVAGILTLPLFGLGALIAGSAMLAYLVGGPEATPSGQPRVWTKAAIVRWSSLGLIPILAAPVIALLVANQTNANGLLHGHQWTALMLLTTCVVAAVCGVIVESVAWWAAIFNSRRLADKTWFNVLVWSGIVATLTMPLFGLGALIAAAVGIAYRSAAPDATDINQAPPKAQAAAA
jgi:hypothetical protein